MKNCLLCLLCLLTLTGCAFRTAPSVTTRKPVLLDDGRIEFETTTAKGSAGVAWGDARQAFESEKLTAGKTLTIGTKGAELETSATNLPGTLKSAGGLIGEAVRSFVAP